MAVILEVTYVLTDAKSLLVSKCLKLGKIHILDRDVSRFIGSHDEFQLDLTYIAHSMRQEEATEWVKYRLILIEG